MPLAVSWISAPWAMMPRTILAGRPSSCVRSPLSSSIRIYVSMFLAVELKDPRGAETR
jgi:hypothetical protein